MTKVIQDIELLKRLQPLLEEVKTEYVYLYYPSEKWSKKRIYNYACKMLIKHHWCYIDYKTLTLEEAIEFLPICINNNYFTSWRTEKWHWCSYLEKDDDELYILDRGLNTNIYHKETLLQAIEKMLTYLIDNKLIWTN